MCHPPICVRWPGWVRGWCRLRMVEGPRTDKLLLSRRGVRSLPESGHSGGNCQQQATTTCRHQHPPLRRGRHPATNTNTAVPSKTSYSSYIVFHLEMYFSSAFLVLLLCTAGFIQRRGDSSHMQETGHQGHFTVENLPPMLFHGKKMCQQCCFTIKISNSCILDVGRIGHWM